jgi:arylsulfatase A-like enzyme
LIGHVKLPVGAPNILFVFIDDADFGNPSTFGGPIRTPTYDRTAAQVLRYNRFHVTAMCSPTRAALLTGRNHHAVDMGGIPEFSGGFPGYSAMLPRDAAPFPKILKENGYATAGIGKWHLTPEKEQGPGWPVQPLAQRLGLRLLLGLPGPRGRAVRHHDLGEPRSPRRHGSRAAGTMMRRAAGEHYLHRPPPRAAVRGVPDAAAVPRGTGDDPGRAPTTTSATWALASTGTATSA